MMRTTRSDRLGVALVLVLATGCVGQIGGSSGAARANDAEVRWSEDVRFPEDDPAFQTAELSSDFTELALRYGGPPAFSIAPGDIVTGRSGGGYLLRVTSVERPDASTLLLHTTGTPLTDAIVDLNLIYDSRSVQEPTGEFVTDDVAGRSEALTTSLRFRLSEHASIVVAGIDNAEVSFEDSELSVSPELRAQLVIRGRHVELLEIEVEACAHLRAVVHARALGPVSAGVSVAIPLSVEIPLTIGPVPATFRLQPTVSVALRAGEGTELRTGVDADVCFVAGGRYDGVTDTFTPIWEPSVSATVIGPELGEGSELSLSLGAGPRATLYFFGVVGPTVALSAYGRGTVTADAAGLGWALYGGVRASLGIDVRVPGASLLRGVRFEHTFPPLELPLASGRLGGGPAGPAGCASDADCATGERCEAGACVAAPPPVAECTSDADCASGERCVSGACVAAPPPAPECTSDADCASGERCASGACVAAPPPPECTTDADCASGQRCVSARCVTAPTSTCGGLPPGTNGDPCTSVTPETWRCACDPTWGDVSQVCRGGTWLSFSTSPSDCSRCAGAYSSGCAS